MDVGAAKGFVDNWVPLTEFHTQTALIDRLLRTERLLAFVAGAFGLVALTLAAVGIGGLLAYTVARRTNEIGVRMAMGAAVSDVIRMVLRDSLWMVGTGLLIGLPSAYAIGRVLKSSLFRLEPLDPVTAALSLVMLVSIALLAAWIPARRAARIDPMVALRAE
jgi:ABC-type antimicrobial peptide transport system permease subunit